MPDIYLGWSQIHLGQTAPDGSTGDNAWQTFGLDLDGVCTNSETCPSQVNVQACAAATVQIPFDGKLCRDNTFASLQPIAAMVPEIGERFGISESVINCNLWRGSYGILLKLTGYNGKQNDSDVRVDFYTTLGLEQPQSWQCPSDDYRAHYPLWRASQKWAIDAQSLSAPITTPGQLPASTVADPHAYVRNGYLVARTPNEAVLRLAGDGHPMRGFSLTVQQGVWLGALSKGQDGTWSIHDGMAAGRIRSEDLIRSFREVGLCQGLGLDSFYNSVVDYIHENADLLADGENAPDKPCDAISMAIAFDAAQVSPGSARMALPLVECCEAGTPLEDCNPVCGDGRVNGDERCDTAIPQGQPGACPTDCPPINACTPRQLMGSGCNAQCVDQPIVEVGHKDGCCPAGADATIDADCTSTCGNGVVEAGETCDPIDSCPDCAPSDACLEAKASGSRQQCTASCQLTPITTCRDNDGCCPAGCGTANDSDCSQSCGNLVVEAGETCEPRTAAGCPTSCDDGDPCTTDLMTGSSANCNTTCTHVPVTKPTDGDGCCPSGANANNDDDCTASCGNGRIESGEACDDGNMVAGDGCTPDCKIESVFDMCLQKIGNDDACARCNCDKCQSQAMACYAATPQADVDLCRALVDCGLEQGCASDTCYCGDSGLNCAVGLGNGPCRAQVEAAAKSTSISDILARRDDTSYPVGRANQLAACASSNCASECNIQQ